MLVKEAPDVIYPDPRFVPSRLWQAVDDILYIDVAQWQPLINAPIIGISIAT